MGIAELLSLKSDYEKELLMAQAKVAVIDDIIARVQPVDEVVDEVESENEDAVEPTENIDNNY